MLVLKHHVCGTVLQQPWETNTHSIQALLLTASTALPANPTDGLTSLPGTLATMKTQLAGRLRKWDTRLKRKSPHILQLADEFWNISVHILAWAEVRVHNKTAFWRWRMPLGFRGHHSKFKFPCLASHIHREWDFGVTLYDPNTYSGNWIFTITVLSNWM